MQRKEPQNFDIYDVNDFRSSEDTLAFDEFLATLENTDVTGHEFDQIINKPRTITGKHHFSYKDANNVIKEVMDVDIECVEYNNADDIKNYKKNPYYFLDGSKYSEKNQPITIAKLQSLHLGSRSCYHFLVDEITNNIFPVLTKNQYSYYTQTQPFKIPEDHKINYLTGLNIVLQLFSHLYEGNRKFNISILPVKQNNNTSVRPIIQNHLTQNTNLNPAKINSSVGPKHLSIFHADLVQQTTTTTSQSSKRGIEDNHFSPKRSKQNN